MLIGRQSELDDLVARLDGDRPVAVLGEPGVGKTTLVRAAAERAGQPLVEAGALATLAWQPYFPLRRAFGQGLDGDAEYVVRNAEAELRGALLFLDDLQWADTRTISLLPLLGARVRLVIAVRRGDPGTAAALEAAAAAGSWLMPLEPLADAAAAELASVLHPGLSDTATRKLVERSGGNPFLVEQLAAGGEPSESLRRALAARLRGLSSAGRDAMGMLALLGHPADAQLLGTGAVELVAAGLANGEDEVTIRHQLLAEAATASLSDDERRAVHSRIAALLESAGEAARHHAQAGETELALEKALRAADRATTPGERAAHLAVAGSVAAGPEANEIRLRAARALLEDDRATEADAVLDAVDATDPLVAGDACLLRCRACLAQHDTAGARSAWERGTTLVEGSGSELELDLRVEEPVLIGLVVVDDDGRSALRAAERAHTTMLERGIDRPRARQVLGMCRLEAGVAGWEEELTAAMSGARTEGDLQTQVASGRTLSYGYLVTGRIDAGRRHIAALAEEMHDLHLTGPERAFRVHLAGFHLHGGSPAKTVTAVEDVLAEGVAPNVGTGARMWLAQALIDLGRYDDARAVIDELVANTPHDHPSYAATLWTLTELELSSGRVREAVVVADECLARFPGEGPAIFVKLARCWAALELGVELGAPMATPFHPMGEAAPVEEEAVHALAENHPRRAAELFAQATSLWRGRHSRGELRCLWAEGEALRRAGELEAAIDRLMATEREAVARDSLAHVARIRRSLRLAGVHRAADRTRDGQLTGREAEVLELVAAGLTNAEIALRLGVGRPTVARLIRTASQKLGAGNRAQAAALAARR